MLKKLFGLAPVYTGNSLHTEIHFHLMIQQLQ